MWGSFLASHARRQLAFDIWWLGFALWLICIIERDDIQDPGSNGWFTIFSCLFELTSAYGTVGLSLGTPFDNFSLSGRFHTLSKLVVCAVMIRGRHRGLPVAIDRAILLPTELEQEDMLDDDVSHMDESWDRDSTFVRDPTTAPRTSMSVVDRQRSHSYGEGVGEDKLGASSGVSFAIHPLATKARRSSVPPTAMEPLSPKQHAEAAHEPRRSFTLTLPPSSLPLHLQPPPSTGYAPGNAPLVSSPAPLTAIDEMPSGSGATPLSESRSESPAPKQNPTAWPPSFHNASHKGKERQVDRETERHMAERAGCSTPNGRDDPVSGRP